MAIDVSFNTVDDYNRESVKRFEGVATVLATAQTDATGLLADFAGLSLAGVRGRTFHVFEVQSEAVEAGANIDAGGTIHCRLNNGKKYAFKIPAIDPAVVNPDGTINIAAAAVTDFIANFLTGGQYRVSEGNYVVDILYGELDR